jgi:hypothetical protein
MSRFALCLAGSFCALFGIGGSACAGVYDFSSGAGTQHFAYGVSIFIPAPPTSNATPTIAFNTTNYTGVSTSNDVRYSARFGASPRRAHLCW